jgi:hypothetical protein
MLLLRSSLVKPHLASNYVIAACPQSLSLPFKSEDRRDFTKQCCHYFEIVNNLFPFEPIECIFDTQYCLEPFDRDFKRNNLFLTISIH